MTNDPERIRALLEPCGYDDTEAFGLHGPRLENFFSWQGALTHFLNDKAQLGAKQKLLHRTCGAAIEVTSAESGEGFVCRPKHGAWASKYLPASTIDEAVNQILLCVFDLTDPRQTQGNL